MRHHGAHTTGPPQGWGEPQRTGSQNSFEPRQVLSPFEKEHSAEAWRPVRGGGSQVEQKDGGSLEGWVVTQETMNKVSFRDELNLRVKDKEAPGIVPRF